MRRRAGTAAAAAAVVLAALVPAAGPAVAADSTLTVVDVVVTPTHDDLADGFGTLTVDVALRAPEPLPDVIQCGVMGEGPGAAAVAVAGSRPWERPWEWSGHLSFDDLTRVSGTATDGVWRASRELTQVDTGSWIVSEVCDPTVSSITTTDVTEHQATFDVGPTTGPSWVISPASAPVKVVTGKESWVPRARVTDRVTGQAVAGAPWSEFSIFFQPVLSPTNRLGPTPALPRADAQGFVQVVGPAQVVMDDGEQDRRWLLAYGGRGGRGYSWEAETVVWPNVKWQANERFSTTGRTVTASGNAWPAPAVYPAANPTIHLQQLVGRTWRTVASSAVRGNGRYTIVWSAPTTGPQVLRVYKPGGATPGPVYLTSTGSTLAAVTVTTS